MKKLLLIFMLLLTFVSVYAAPTVTNQVTDFADLLTDEQESSLSNHIDVVEESSSVEIAVVTVKSTDGQDRIMFATEIGQNSGVGKKDLDNGIVVLWSVADEKGGAIATGRGIESVLNDAKVARIGRASREKFDEGNYYKGFDQILTRLQVDISNDNSQFTVYLGETSLDAADLPWWAWAIIIPLSIWVLSLGDWFLIFFILKMISGGKGNNGRFGGGSFGGAGGRF